MQCMANSSPCNQIPDHLGSICARLEEDTPNFEQLKGLNCLELRETWFDLGIDEISSEQDLKTLENAFEIKAGLLQEI